MKAAGSRIVRTRLAESTAAPQTGNAKKTVVQSIDVVNPLAAIPGCFTPSRHKALGPSNRMRDVYAPRAAVLPSLMTLLTGCG